MSAAIASRRRRPTALATTRGSLCDEVAPGSHGHAKRDDVRLFATGAKPRHFAETRMSRPPPHVHGKEGVDGSSPSEGSAKAPVIGAFSIDCPRGSYGLGGEWSNFWSSQTRLSFGTILS
jgi:hypothetical protein